MAESANSLARRGLISTKAFNSTLAKTKLQKTKMADFDGRRKDEGKPATGDGMAGMDHIDNSQTQRDRARSMPSRKTGNVGGGAVGSAARSKSPQGGRVDAQQIPRRAQIDTFPGKQRATFPKGAGYVGKGAAGANTRMKGAKPLRSGGPWGGPNSRAAG